MPVSAQRPPTTEGRLTLAEAAVALGIAGRTLTGWIAAKKVRVVRVSPRLVFVERAEVKRVLRGEK